MLLPRTMSHLVTKRMDHPKILLKLSNGIKKLLIWYLISYFIYLSFFIVIHQDFPEACSQLAKIYFQRKDGNNNETKGALWLIRAAENRHEDAVGVLMSSREPFDVFIPIWYTTIFNVIVAENTCSINGRSDAP